MVVVRVWFGPELQWETCPSRWQNCTRKGGVETTHLRFMSRIGSSMSLAECTHTHNRFVDAPCKMRREPCDCTVETVKYLREYI